MNPDPASLENLRDLALPPPVPLWPPAPGWSILAAGLAAASLVAGWRSWRRYRANAYRREARRQLDAIARRVEAGRCAGAASELAVVLKRTALAAYPRSAVASLTGPAWLGFLDRTGRTTAFTDGAARGIAEWTFAGDRAVPAAALKAALRDARAWVRAHGRWDGRSEGTDRC
ncbi:DUF4381 domain-containing protein [Methylobacterium frigidaeris]|uniref:DUF4381 domain-containing protein n=1 Tax=Methylobacterium frigidaeris TaxID=2038277 RepID=A0AA37M829_9HYPH|nr:DUF4381 domain-containing protein [Methylobacterium frigidaeris]GJD65694.1 hypothetical protein MPEAHAMD_5889 [Methylobacterium frigidaeris]